MKGRGKSGEFLAGYNKEFCSDRMAKNNPMSKPEIVEKMKITKRKNGSYNICPVSRGGNGKQISVPQANLAEILGWGTEVVVRTKALKEAIESMPNHYKIDIANNEKKIAIEVDGSSHRGKRKQKDKKKEAFLKMSGWKVLRFTNREIMENMSMCVDRVLSMI
jgi:hypothetical protein